MKKRKSIGLWVGICLLFLGILGSVNVFAAVTEGKAGETLTGEYAVIINTDTSDSRSTYNFHPRLFPALCAHCSL